MIRPWVAIQRNPSSGSGRRRRFLLELAAALNRNGLRPHLFSRRETLACRLQDPDRRAALAGVIAAGGDGTLADVANRHPGIPVCPFPLGTENLLAKYLRIPLDGDFVARMIAAGHRRRVDVGLVGNGTRFLIMGSVGFDAEVIHQLHSTRRGNISHLSYVSPIWRSALHYSFPELTVSFDESAEPVKGSLVVVSNFPAYAFGLPVNPDAQPDDGLLTVRIFQQPGRWNLTRYSTMVMRRVHLDQPDVRVIRTANVTVKSPVDAPVQIDGDPFGTTSVQFRCLPGELELFVPETGS